MGFSLCQVDMDETRNPPTAVQSAQRALISASSGEALTLYWSKTPPKSITRPIPVKNDGSQNKNLAVVACSRARVRVQIFPKTDESIRVKAHHLLQIFPTGLGGHHLGCLRSKYSSRFLLTVPTTWITHRYYAQIPRRPATLRTWDRCCPISVRIEIRPTGRPPVRSRPRASGRAIRRSSCSRSGSLINVSDNDFEGLSRHIRHLYPLKRPPPPAVQESLGSTHPSGLRLPTLHDRGESRNRLFRPLPRQLPHMGFFPGSAAWVPRLPRLERAALPAPLRCSLTALSHRQNPCRYPNSPQRRTTSIGYSLGRQRTKMPPTPINWPF